MGSVPAQPKDRPAGDARKPSTTAARQPWVALRRLLRGCQHALLYPPEHQEFEGALQLAFDGCHDLLALHSPCTLHLGSGGLHLMGQPCPKDAGSNRFAARLWEREIPAITLLEGITKLEVQALLELLKADATSVAEQGGAAAWLARAHVQHITCTRPDSRPEAPPDYQANWEAFLDKQDAADGAAFEGLLALCPEAARSALLGSDAESVLWWLAQTLGLAAAAVPDRGGWLRQVVSGVRRLAPELRGRLFRLPADPESDVLRDLARLLAPEEAAQALVSYPNAVVGEPSEQLEIVLPRLLPDGERARQVEPLVKAQLLARGMTEESYLSVVSLLLRKQPPGASPSVPADGKGVRRVSFLGDLLASTSSNAMREAQTDVWLELATSSRTQEERARVFAHLADSLPSALAEASDAHAVEVLGRVEAAIASGELTPGEKRLLRRSLTYACSPEFCGRLARFLVREPSPESQGALQLLTQAEAGFDALLYIAKETQEAWLQGAAGAAIVHMGERSLEPCYRWLSGGALEEATGLARALVRSNTREGLARALWAHEHPKPAVAAALMEALAFSRDDRAERVLLAALRQAPAEVQSAAAWALGYHPSDQALAALRAVLSNPLGVRRTEVVKSALVALGQMGRAEAVPTLRAVLRRRHLLFRGHARELRELACQALGRIPDPAAEQALREEAREDPEGLAAFCEQALEARRLALPVEARRESVG